MERSPEMIELTPRTIEWIDRAPMHARGVAVSTASPSAVFDVLADHEGWSEWFPGVKAVDVLGPRAGVGARRRVRIPMLTVDEEFIVWDPGARWSFTGTASSRRFTRSLVEDCVLVERADGGTDITYTMYFDPVGAAGWLMRVSTPRVSRSIEAGVQALAIRAARSG